MQKFVSFAIIKKLRKIYKLNIFPEVMFAEQEFNSAQYIGRALGYVFNLMMLSLIPFSISKISGNAPKSVYYLHITLIILTIALLGKIIRKYLAS